MGAQNLIMGIFAKKRFYNKKVFTVFWQLII